MMDFAFLLWVVSFLGIKLVAYSLAMRFACGIFNQPVDKWVEYGAARLIVGLVSIPLIFIWMTLLISGTLNGFWICVLIFLVSFSSWASVAWRCFDPEIESPGKTAKIAAIGALLSSTLNALFFYISGIEFMGLPIPG